MKKFLMLGTALVALGAISPAFASPDDKGPGKGDRFFAKMDTDGDGVVSKSEFEAHGDEMFSKMDGNGDGKIEKDEAKAAHEKMRERWKEHREKRMENREERRGEKSDD